MPNCTAFLADPELASKVVWNGMPGERVAVLLCGLAFTLFTLLLYFFLIVKHRQRASAMVTSDAGQLFRPYKFGLQEQLLCLGPVMVIFFAVQMCAPELTSMANLFQTTYKAIAYVLLMRICGVQFGNRWNLFRSNGTGTLQNHPEELIWVQPPCCCIWIFFIPFMKKRIVSKKDALIIRKLIYQVCFIGPAMAVLQMMCYYEGISAQHVSTVNMASNVVILASMLTAVYGCRIVCHIAEKNLPIQYQLRERAWFTHGPAEAEKPAPVDNIKAKASWISVVSVLPGAVAVIVSLSVEGDICYDNGNVFMQEDLRNYITGFVCVLLNFAGAIFACVKAFPVEDVSDRTEVIEYVTANMLEMEVYPAFVLELFLKSINGIIRKRELGGEDINFGLKQSDQWRKLFGVESEVRSI